MNQSLIEVPKKISELLLFVLNKKVKNYFQLETFEIIKIRLSVVKETTFLLYSKIEKSSIVV